MPTRERMARMTVGQLRKLAREWPTQEIDQLSQAALIEYIVQAQRLESTPVTELRSLGRDWQIKGVSRMESGDLVLRILRAQRLDELTLAGLRSLARERQLENVARLKKKELIQRLLQAEAWQVQSSVAHSTIPEALGRPRPRPEDREKVMRWRQWLRVAMQVASGLGMIFCLVGVIVLPFLSSRGIKVARGALATTADTAHTAADSLRLVGDSLGQAASALEGGGATLQTVGGSLESAEPLLRSVGEIAGNEVPTTIEAAQQALLAAEGGAKSIDQVLRALASLEPLTGVTYDPEQSLDHSLANVATGLDPLPAALREVQGDLDAVIDDISPLQASLEATADDLVSFSVSLIRLQEHTYDQVSAFERLASTTEQAGARVSAWILGGTIVVELILIVVGLEQCSLFLIGGQLWARDRWDSSPGDQP